MFVASKSNLGMPNPHQVALVVKNPACQYWRQKKHGFYPWVRKIPWKSVGQPTPVFLSGESHGWRSLGGYCPWGCRVRHNWSDLTCTFHWITNSPKAGAISLLSKNLFGRCSKIYVNWMAFLSPLKQLWAAGTSELGLYVHLFIQLLSKGLLVVCLM